MAVGTSGMIATLNDFTINDPSNSDVRVYLDEIEGLEIPPIRTSRGERVGADGGFIGPQFFASRDITLTGTVFASDVADLEETKRDFQAALSSKAVTFRLVTNAGAAYIVYCNLVDFKMPIDREIFKAAFKLELLAVDPIIYDDAAGTELSVIVPKEMAGGYEYPVEYPVIYGAAVGATTVTNNGTTAVAPRIILIDVMTNPVLTNKTTGEVLAFDDLVTAPGDEVVIDMRAHTATLNGGSIFAKVLDPKQWWALQPGDNLISLTSGDSGDTVEAEVLWRSGYLGI